MAFKFKWLGQAGFIFTLGDDRLVIDPFLSYEDQFMRQHPIPIEPQELAADMIIITHDHCDHLNPATLREVDWTRTVCSAPLDCFEHLTQIGVPVGKIQRFSAGDIYHLGEARIMSVPAYHTTPEAVGAVVEYHGVKLYITGDTLYREELKNTGVFGIDVLFICINGRLGNMNADEAAKTALGLPCRVAIPDHYDMFAENSADPNEFVAALNKAETANAVMPFICEFDKEYDIYDLLRKAENAKP